MFVDSRTSLVETMSELMWERGFAATSPREVRQRSGVGQGSMYHHFPTKRDLGLAALERNCADLLPATEELLTGPGDPMAKLVAYLSRPREALRGCKIGRMTQDPQVAADPVLLAPITEAFAAVHRALAEVIRQAIEAGQLPAQLNPVHLAATLSATIQGGYVLAIAAQDSERYESACAGALELLRASAAALANPAASNAASVDEDGLK